MKRLSLFIYTLTCLWIPGVNADIYTWSDENGIMHFSNRNSHPEATLYLKTMEGPYEEALERAQREAERQRELERAQAEIRLQEARLAEKIATLERRTAEAKQKTQEALDRAEALEKAADRRYRDDRWYATGYASSYPGYYDYRYYGVNGYRFSVTYPGSKRYKKHRYRPVGSHKQIDGGKYRNRDRHFQGNRNSRYGRHTAGQAAFSGHRRGGWRR
jgi:hypothetical protein